MPEEAHQEGNVVEQRDVAAPHAGQDQQVLRLARIVCGHHHAVGVRLQEEDEELLLDRVDRNAAVAHRALDEGFDFVLGVVEQELVARAHGDVGKRGERVAGDRVCVTGQVLHVPLRLQEGPPDPLELLRGEVVGDVGLVDDRSVVPHQAVVKAAGARIVVRPPRRDLVDARFARGA